MCFLKDISGAFSAARQLTEGKGGSSGAGGRTGRPVDGLNPRKSLFSYLFIYVRPTHEFSCQLVDKGPLRAALDWGWTGVGGRVVCRSEYDKL